MLSFFCLVTIAVVSGLRTNQTRLGGTVPDISYLGTAYNLWTDDFWGGVISIGNAIYQPFNPQSCAAVQKNPSVMVTSQQEFFQSTEDLEASFSNEAKLGVTYMGMWGGSVQASYKSSTSHHQERRSMKVYYSSQIGKMKFQADCFTKPLSTAFISTVKKMPVKLATEQDYKTWKSLFFDVYGSHIATEVLISAKMRYLSSVSAKCDAKASDLCVGACATFSDAGVKVQGCDTTCTNKSTSACAKQQTVSMEFAGGDRTKADYLATHPITASAVQAWLDSASIVTGVTDISGFQPISTILQEHGYSAQGAAAQKVMESGYLGGCFSTQKFMKLPNGDFKCVCQLTDATCKNGGSLDMNKCVCKCCGDTKHGWTGASCTGSYGLCQTGPGSGNTGSACKNSNQCKSWFSHSTCGNTQVCCNTDFHSLCCPLGSQCSCGSSTCKCVNQVKCPNTVPVAYQNFPQ